MNTHTAEREANLLLEAASRALARAGVESARLDAELLLACAAGVTRLGVLTGLRDLTPLARARFEELLARRLAREPLAYIVGRKEFFSLEFEVTPDVLIPRPETETLVAGALGFLASRPGSVVLDLGTGSGAIAVAVAVSAPLARVVATDVCPGAIEVARRNALRHDCSERIELRLGDCFEPVRSGEKFDLIVSNPPYIEESAFAGLEPELVRYEPRIAVAGGADGLDFYRRIAARAPDLLPSGREAMVEVGAGQADRVAALFVASGAHKVETITDLGGIERVVRARF